MRLEHATVASEGRKTDGFLPLYEDAGVHAALIPQPGEILHHGRSSRHAALPRHAVDVAWHAPMQVLAEQRSDAVHGHGPVRVVVDDASHLREGPRHLHELVGGVAPDGKLAVGGVEVDHGAEELQ